MTHTVKITHQGNTKTIEVSPEETILNAALEAGIDLPNSCNAGVCTTCAALVTEGTVEQPDALGVSQELQKEGYALLCVAHARSNLKIESEKEEIVYDRQFGKP